MGSDCERETKMDLEQLRVDCVRQENVFLRIEGWQGKKRGSFENLVDGLRG